MIDASEIKRLQQKPLSHLVCQHAKPAAKNYKLRDFTHKGLYLLVRSSGGKSWQYDYKVKSNDDRYIDKTYVYGTFPELSLAEAREKHLEVKRLRKEGIDPNDYKKEQKRQYRENKLLTFAVVADEWLVKKDGTVKPLTFQHYITRLNTDILPEIGDMPIRDIRAVHVVEMLDKIEARGAYELLKRARQICSQVFCHAIARGILERDVTAEIRNAHRKAPTQHHHALSPDEIYEFLAALERNEARLFELTRAALELQMLTFVRPIEVASAEWQHVNFDDELWSIPAAKMKMNHDHVIPLPAQSIAILRRVQTKTGNRQHVFPKQSDPRSHMSRDTLSKAIRNLGFQGRHTAHGFRAMARTAIRERLGWDSEVIERQLAHKPSGSLGAAYDRTQFLAQRKEMLQEWADYLDELRKQNA